jgi:hypothetical protein
MTASFRAEPMLVLGAIDARITREQTFTGELDDADYLDFKERPILHSRLA